MHLGQECAEALPLGDAPAGKARRKRVGAADVDMDSADLERARAVDGQDPAIAALQLAVKHSRKSEDGNQQQKWGDETVALHSRRLLATTAWKSKRDVGSSHIPLALSMSKGCIFLCEDEGQAFDKLRPNGS